jgi:hypothetical protein
VKAFALTVRQNPGPYERVRSFTKSGMRDRISHRTVLQKFLADRDNKIINAEVSVKKSFIGYFWRPLPHQELLMQIEFLIMKKVLP